MKLGLMITFVVILVGCFAYFHKEFIFNYGKVSTGNGWHAKQFGYKYIVSIDNHSEIVSSFLDFINAKNIKSGEIIGLGAVNQATLRFFDPATKKYVDKTFNEQMELSNLIGNISTKDGKPYLHIHATFGTSDYKAIAGHLLSAKINGAGEFYLTVIKNSLVERTEDKDLGLNIYKF